MVVVGDPAADCPSSAVGVGAAAVICSPGVLALASAPAPLSPAPVVDNHDADDDNGLDGGDDLAVNCCASVRARTRSSSDDRDLSLGLNPTCIHDYLGNRAQLAALFSLLCFSVRLSDALK